MRRRKKSISESEDEGDASFVVPDDVIEYMDEGDEGDEGDNEEASLAAFHQRQMEEAFQKHSLNHTEADSASYREKIYSDEDEGEEGDEGESDESYRASEEEESLASSDTDESSESSDSEPRRRKKKPPVKKPPAKKGACQSSSPVLPPPYDPTPLKTTISHSPPPAYDLHDEEQAPKRKLRRKQIDDSEEANTAQRRPRAGKDEEHGKRRVQTENKASSSCSFSSSFSSSSSFLSSSSSASSSSVSCPSASIPVSSVPWSIPVEASRFFSNGSEILQVRLEAFPKVPLSVRVAVFDKLTPCQRDTFEWLWGLHLSKQGGIFADDVSLSKPFQVCAFISSLFLSQHIKRALIMVPTASLPQWQSEVQEWCGAIRIHVFHAKKKNEAEMSRVMQRGGIVITTHGMVTSHLSTLSEVPGSARSWDYVVVEDAMKIKNPDTQLSQAARKLPAMHRLALIGVSLQHNLDDVWSLFDFVTAGSVLGDRPTFKAAYADKIQAANKRSASSQDKKTAKELSEALQALTSPLLLRREASATTHDPRAHILFNQLPMPLLAENHLENKAKDASDEVAEMAEIENKTKTLSLGDSQKAVQDQGLLDRRNAADNKDNEAEHDPSSSPSVARLPLEQSGQSDCDSENKTKAIDVPMNEAQKGGYDIWQEIEAQENLNTAQKIAKELSHVNLALNKLKNSPLCSGASSLLQSSTSSNAPLFPTSISNSPQDTSGGSLKSSKISDPSDVALHTLSPNPRPHTFSQQDSSASPIHTSDSPFRAVPSNLIYSFDAHSSDVVTPSFLHSSAMHQTATVSDSSRHALSSPKRLVCSKHARVRICDGLTFDCFRCRCFLDAGQARQYEDLVSGVASLPQLRRWMCALRICDDDPILHAKILTCARDLSIDFPPAKA